MRMRGVGNGLAFVLSGLVSLALGIGCDGADGSGGDQPSSQASSIPRFDGTVAYQLVERQVEFGPRVPGTPGHHAMAAWLEDYLAARADSLVLQRFRHVTVEGDTISLVNVLARFGPIDARAILFLAHWDTRPVADQAFDSAERELAVPGANDGGSGVAILLELADIMSQTPPPGAVDILLVDGEDYGDFSLGKDVFLGSRYFARNLPAGYDIEYGVLLDMVGDRDLEIFVEGNSNRLAPGAVDRVWNVAQRLGFGDIFQREVRHTINDDHIALNAAGIPTVNVIDFDYPYWHTAEDTPDKVSASSLGAVGTVMTRLVYSGR